MAEGPHVLVIATSEGRDELARELSHHRAEGSLIPAAELPDITANGMRLSRCNSSSDDVPHLLSINRVFSMLEDLSGSL